MGVLTDRLTLLLAEMEASDRRLQERTEALLADVKASIAEIEANDWKYLEEWE